MNRRRKVTPRAESEKTIENDILLFLELHGIYAWKNQSVGIYDPRKKKFLKAMNRFHINGVSDILGVFKGKPLAIEVKSKTGRLSDDQKTFLANFQKAGGIALVCRSVEDVKQDLGL